MSIQSKIFAIALSAASLAGASGAAYAQAAGNGGGGGGGGVGGGGGGPTLTAVTIRATVPGNTTRPPKQGGGDTSHGCVTPTEGIRGVKPVQGPCGPY